MSANKHETRVELGGGWRWWPHAIVRGAGFPADRVDRLGAPELAERAEALLGSSDDDKWHDFRARYSAAAVRADGELQEVAAAADFRLAVAWQNHRLIDGALTPFLSREPEARNRSAKQRSREQLVASYLQRYCVKNDSIG